MIDQVCEFMCVFLCVIIMYVLEMFVVDVDLLQSLAIAMLCVVVCKL